MQTNPIREEVDIQMKMKVGYGVRNVKLIGFQ